MQKYFEFSNEVTTALAEKQPILALESTLITHGLDYPSNLEIALEVESIAKEAGVTPATIAIMDGKIKIGLTTTELEKLATQKNIHKASTRDLAYLLSHGLSAGTTVAATMYCAHRAGIRVFATGGIGGVHRGEDLDISADLLEFTRTPVAVVCAGAKAILDLAKTLEYLETHSIALVGYQTDYLPAFYSSQSEFQLSAKVNDLPSLARFVKTHWDFNMTSGIVIANPIPQADEISNNEIEPVIQAALIKANAKNIRGKAITPFLLREVAQVTQGKSVKANLALIRNNVRLGSQLAKYISGQS